MFHCLKISYLKNIFCGNPLKFMNKYKINPLLIHVKENKQTMRVNYVVVLSLQNARPYFEWNHLLGRMSQTHWS